MPTKTIAVPTSPAARRKRGVAKAVVVDHDETAAAPLMGSLRRAPRPIAAHPAHRFQIGDRLRMANGGYSVARAGAYCKVVSLLPYEGHGSLLYRVRSDNEAHERIVAEADLARE